QNKRPGRRRIRLHNLFDPATNRPQFNFDLDSSEPQPLNVTQDGKEGNLEKVAAGEPEPGTSGEGNNAPGPSNVIPDHQPKAIAVVVEPLTEAAGDGVREVSSSTPLESVPSSQDPVVLNKAGPILARTKSDGFASETNLNRKILINQFQRSNAAKCDLLRQLASSTPNANLVNSRLSTFASSISPILESDSPAGPERATSPVMLIQTDASSQKAHKTVQLMIAPCSQPPLEATPQKNRTFGIPAERPASPDVIVPETPSPPKNPVVESPKAIPMDPTHHRPRRLSVTIEEMAAAGLLHMAEDNCMTSDESQPINNSRENVLLKSILKDRNSTLSERKSMRVSFSNLVHEREISPAPTIEGSLSSTASSSDESSSESDDDEERVVVINPDDYQVTDEVYSDDNSGDNCDMMADYGEFEAIRQELAKSVQKLPEATLPVEDDYQGGFLAEVPETVKKDNRTNHHVLDIVTDWDDEEDPDALRKANEGADYTNIEIPETQRTENATICDARDISSSNIEESAERLIDLPPPPDQFRDVSENPSSSPTPDVAPTGFSSSAKRRFIRENDEAVISRLQSELPLSQPAEHSLDESSTPSEAPAAFEKVSDTLVEIAQSFRDHPAPLLPPKDVESNTIRKTLAGPIKKRRETKNPASESYFQTVEKTFAKPAEVEKTEKKRKLYIARLSSESPEKPIADKPKVNAKPTIKPLKVVVQRLRYADYCKQHCVRTASDTRNDQTGEESNKPTQKVANAGSPETTTIEKRKDTEKPSNDSPAKQVEGPVHAAPAAVEFDSFSSPSPGSSSDENVVTSSSSGVVKSILIGSKRRSAEVVTSDESIPQSKKSSESISTTRKRQQKDDDGKQLQDNVEKQTDPAPQDAQQEEKAIRKVMFDVTQNDSVESPLALPSKPQPALTPYICKKMRAKVQQRENAVLSTDEAMEIDSTEDRANSALIETPSAISMDEPASPDQSGQTDELPNNRNSRRRSPSPPKDVVPQPVVTRLRGKKKMEPEIAKPKKTIIKPKRGRPKKNGQSERDKLAKIRKEDYQITLDPSENLHSPDISPAILPEANGADSPMYELRYEPDEHSSDTEIVPGDPPPVPSQDTDSEIVKPKQQTDVSNSQQKETRQGNTRSKVRIELTDRNEENNEPTAAEPKENPVELEVLTENLPEASGAEVNAQPAGDRPVSKKKPKLRPNFKKGKQRKDTGNIEHPEPAADKEHESIDYTSGANANPAAIEEDHDLPLEAASDEKLGTKRNKPDSKIKRKPKNTKKMHVQRNHVAANDGGSPESGPRYESIEQSSDEGNVSEDPPPLTAPPPSADDVDGESVDPSQPASSKTALSKTVRFFDEIQTTEPTAKSISSKPPKETSSDTVSSDEGNQRPIVDNSATLDSTLEIVNDVNDAFETSDIVLEEQPIEEEAPLQATVSNKLRPKPSTKPRVQNREHVEKHTTESSEKARKVSRFLRDDVDDDDDWVPSRSKKSLKEKANQIRQKLDRTTSSHQTRRAEKEDESEVPRRSGRKCRLAKEILRKNPLLNSEYDRPKYVPFENLDIQRANQLALEARKRQQSRVHRTQNSKPAKSTKAQDIVAPTTSSSTTGRKRNPSPQEVGPANVKRNRCDNDSGVDHLHLESTASSGDLQKTRTASIGVNTSAAEKLEAQSWMMRLMNRDTNASNQALPMAISAADTNFVHMTLDHLRFHERNGIEYSFFIYPEDGKFGFLRFAPKTVKKLTKTENFVLKFFVIQGQLNFVINGEAAAINGGDFLIIPADSKYSISNGDSVSLVFMIKEEVVMNTIESTIPQTSTTNP
ncbi:uncharacterized protein LOC129753902, partial [Uranotaenia lowii]|uniref:uncharacterized protein LOC129753902 n=1 Tax=Uranotaenia lowii TaxID=190385 RepID=UPI00247A7342